MADPPRDSDAGDDSTEVDGDAGTEATKREGAGPRKPGKTASAQFEPGATLGRYKIGEVLGAGGMGVVYAAFDPELNRRVAIKVLQANAGGSESGGQTWLVREAQALALVAHPNVVTVFDVGMMPGDLVYLAMELIDGVTLRAWLDERPRGWREVLAVIRQAGAGLAAAHAAGLIHRDFKPDNVLVGFDGRARVMDFGLARLDGREDPAARPDMIERKSPLSDRLTVTGALLGTPAYMAPEIHRGRPADAIADQFAFGVATYEALYRARPFDRQALREGRAAPPKPPAGRVPAWLERVVLRAIALEPERRYPTMAALLDALTKDPTGKQRAIAIGAGVTLACTSAVVIGFALGGSEPEPVPVEVCNDSAARLAGAWDNAARKSVEASFNKIGKPFVADALGGVDKTLDKYASGWVAMHTEACKATRVHGSQSEEVLTLRMACLDDRRAELAALVHLFAAADDKLVLGSVTAAQKLTTIADCADVPALLAPDPLPKDPAARAAVIDAHGKLAEARATYKTSRLTDTLALLDKLAPAIEKLDHRPTRAEFRLLRGQSLWVMQGGAKGEPELLEAAHVADAGKADVIKVEAWIQLANLANEAGKFDVARERLQNASSALARLGANPMWKVRVLDSEALLESRVGNYDKATKLVTEARELAATTDGNAYAYALLVEASVLTSAGRAGDALESFKKAYKLQDALGHHRIDVSVTLQTMASAELALGKADDSIAHLEDALAISESIYGRDNQEVARGLSALAAAKSQKGDLAGSLATNLEALAVAERAVGKTDEAYGFIAGQVADSLLQLKRAKEAIPYLDTALAIQTAKLGPTSVQVLAIQLTRCDVLHEIGQIKEAAAICKRTLATADKALGPTNPMLFLFLSHTAEVLAGAKQGREAAALLARARKLGATDPSDLHYVEFLEARVRWDLRDKAQALALGKSARDGFAALGDSKKDQVREIDGWLKSHH